MGYHIPFEKRGYKIVSAGHMYDKHFLFRLYHLCSVHQYAASNSIGSNLFYSTAAGCSFFYLNAGEVKHDFLLNTDKGFAAENYINEVKKLFSEPKGAITPVQKECIDNYLGRKHLLTPDELRSILQSAESYYYSRDWKVKRSYLGLFWKLNVYRQRILTILKQGYVFNGSVSRKKYTEKSLLL